MHNRQYGVYIPEEEVTFLCPHKKVTKESGAPYGCMGF